MCLGISQSAYSICSLCFYVTVFFLVTKKDGNEAEYDGGGLVDMVT